MARVDNLSNFLSDVADAIRTKKGTEETIQASDFDTEIASISSGGTTPTNLGEVSQELKNVLEIYEKKGIFSETNNYPTDTNEPITLYSPSSNFKIYFIQKRSSGKYRVCWSEAPLCLSDGGIYPIGYSDIGSAGYFRYENVPFSIKIGRVSQGTGNFYYSQEYDTIEICKQKLLNNELTYTFVNNYLAYIDDTPYKIPYTNAPVYYVSPNIEGFELSQKLSSNETIVTTQ